MIEAQVNMFDLAVFSILGLSALIAFFRGFVREVLSLGAWIGAVVITLYSFPKVAQFLEPYIGDGGVTSGIAGMLTFMAAIILLSVINAFLVRFLKAGSEIGVIDNALGFIFGIARGLLVVAIGFYVMSFFLANSEYPEWLKTSKTKPYVEEIAGLIAKLAPDYLDELEHKPQLEPQEDGPFSEFLDTLPAPQMDGIFEADDNPSSPPAELPKDTPSQWPELDGIRQGAE
jgi:membrane protein required for colicin V production